jgi:dTDP-4-dehydrorhamnose 3,5-epimerase
MPATIQPLEIQGAFLLESEAHHDERGVFYEVWRDSDVRTLGGPTCRIAQVNRSRSVRGVLRGLHYQVGPSAQAKLVTVLAGCIYDVVVDLRTDSRTFGRWESCTLASDKPQQLWIPAGCAHGFLVLSDHADCEYACSNTYDPVAERTLLWNDPTLSIRWPLDAQATPILSPRDRAGILFTEAEKFGRQ